MTSEVKDFYDRLTETDAQPAQLAEDDLKWLMSSLRGRRIMRRFLEVTGQYRSSYVDQNAHGTAFNEGRRFVGLQMLHDVRQFCPEQEFAMHQEARE